MALLLPFQDLYHHINKTDPRLFEALDKISIALKTVFAKLSTVRPDRLVKMGDAGDLVESSVVDDGTRVTVNESLRINGTIGIYTVPAPQRAIDVGGNISASGTAAIGIGVRNILNLIAVANNDSLYGLFINPTFTPGAFTGVTKYGLYVATGENNFIAGKIGFGAIPVAYPVEVTGDVDIITGVLRINGIQVVGPQGAAVVAPTINTLNITDTADSTYSANEVTMLNNLKSAVNQLNTDVTNLATAVDAIRLRLINTGITA